MSTQKTELTVIATEQKKSEITQSQVDLIKRMLCKDATNDELNLFLHVCRATGLDALARQIYAIKRQTKNGPIMTIMVSIDGARLVAARTGKYQGQSGPFWCGEDGAWKEVWLSQKQPSAARVGVWMDGFKEPLWGVATMESYAQKDKMGEVTGLWKTMGDVMLAKCAEMLALRKAAPNELSNMYSEEEMSGQSPKTGSGLGIIEQGGHPSDQGDGVRSTGYVIPFGKYGGRSLEEVGADDLRSYINYLETKAKKDGKRITGVVADFIETAAEFVASFENSEPEQS